MSFSPFSGENPLKMRNNGLGDFYADVEQIRVGLSSPIKPDGVPKADAEVQTTHLVPYRCFIPTFRKTLLIF